MLDNSLVSLFAQSQTSALEDNRPLSGAAARRKQLLRRRDTPRLGLVYNKGKLTAKVLYMQAFRAPKPWDFTNGIGNPDLKPETIYSWEAAGGWSFSPHLRFDLSAYHNRLSNLLTREARGDRLRWVNAGALTTNGCETSWSTGGDD